MQVSWLQRCCLIKTRTPTIRNGIFWIYRRFSIMNSRKTTIDDIRSRKAEVLREMRAVRADINDSIHFIYPSGKPSWPFCLDTGIGKHVVNGQQGLGGL